MTSSSSEFIPSLLLGLFPAVYSVLTCLCRADDMLAILFPHLFEEVEYLLPEEAGVDMLNDDFDDGNDGEAGMNEQAVAGPSRLA